MITLDQVAAADRLDFIHDMVAATWVPMEYQPMSGAGTSGVFRASGIGPMQVVVMDVEPFEVRRTPMLLAQHDPDLMKVAMLARGAKTVVVSQDGREARLCGRTGAAADVHVPAVAAAVLP
jgi:hypothetical protein